MNTKIKSFIMNRGTTYFLRFIIVLMGLIVLALSVFALPSMWMDGSVEYPTASFAVQLIVVGMYVTLVPFYIGLWQTLKLLSLIDMNTAFSDLSVKILKNIKYCAGIIAVFYVAGVPLLYPIADADDAPGLIIIGMVVACAPVAVAVFAEILQKLLHNALDMKSENDLTV